MRRLLLALAACGILGLAAAVGAVQWFDHAWTAPGPLSGERVVVVERGEGLEQIAARLIAAGALHPEPLRGRWPFLLGARLTGAARALKAGEYAIPAGASPAAIAALLVEGRALVRRLTVPEGLTTAEVLALVAAAEGLVGPPPQPPPAEGSLLPETYHYQRGDSRAGLVRRMEQAMREALAEAWAARAEGLPLADPGEALVLASIIEKETAVAAERARVAAVFVNRLRRGMRLQSDPTAAFGLAAGAPLGRELTRADLRAANPYNTYVIDGLPPGPIANPGRDSLRAATRPAVTDELYFVADGSGGHAFARTLADHNRNVAAWRRLQRQRGAAPED